MNKTTQDSQVLTHLKQGRTLTQLEAIQLYGCYRLSAVVHRLRNAGNNIVTYRERNKSTNGTHARYEYQGAI
ncbi:DNA-binding protein [Acinetobacter baumannii]|nr:DNA-binding protein [Acinetobacter baumannii]